MRVEPLEVFGFHPDAGLVIEPVGRLPDKHGFYQISIFFLCHFRYLLVSRFFDQSRSLEKL
jgi:hypothetical protein